MIKRPFQAPDTIWRALHDGREYFQALLLPTMRQGILTVLLFLSALACFAQADPITGGAKEVTPAQLSAMFGSATLFVYDCNETDMYAEAHVPGATLIVYDEVSLDKLPADRSATLVFYCYSPECPAAATAAHTAAGFGFTDVYYMLAGITGWQDAGLPTEP